jgi:hypothetical protein
MVNNPSFKLSFDRHAHKSSGSVLRPFSAIPGQHEMAGA